MAKLNSILHKALLGCLWRLDLKIL